MTKNKIRAVRLDMVVILINQNNFHYQNKLKTAVKFLKYDLHNLKKTACTQCSVNS